MIDKIWILMERIAKYGNLITFIHVKLLVEFKIFVFIIQI